MLYKFSLENLTFSQSKEWYFKQTVSLYMTEKRDFVEVADPLKVPGYTTIYEIIPFH